MKSSSTHRSWHRRARAILIPALAAAACTTSGPVTASSALFDVPYADVAALSARAEDRRLEYGTDPLQFALGWLPSGPARALVVFVHGGCWLSEYDVEHGRALTAALADAGFEAWALEYRRSGDDGGGWPGSLEDVVAGVSAVHEERGARPLLLIGHSAGGHLGLLATARMRGEVRAGIGLAAITDVAAYAGGDSGCQRATAGFFGGSPEELPQSYREATVTVRGLEGRAILLQGDADAIVPVAQASVAGVESRRLEGVGHFDWVHPGSHAFDVLLTELEALALETPALEGSAAP